MQSASSPSSSWNDLLRCAATLALAWALFAPGGGWCWRAQAQVPQVISKDRPPGSQAGRAEDGAVPKAPPGAASHSPDSQLSGNSEPKGDEKFAAEPGVVVKGSAEDTQDERKPRVAYLVVQLQARGDASVKFFGAGFHALAPRWNARIEAALGCRLQQFSGRGVREWVAGGRCQLAVAKSGLQYHGAIHLAPLIEALRAAQATPLTVSMVQTDGVEQRCAPDGQMKSQGKSSCIYEIVLAPKEAAPTSIRQPSPATVPQTPGANEAGPKTAAEDAAVGVVETIDFYYGFTEAQIRRMFAVLGTVPLLPVLLTLWMRRAALRAAERITLGHSARGAGASLAGDTHDDRAGIWFGYWRFLHWTVNGTLILWSAACDETRLIEFLHFLFPGGGSVQAAWGYNLADRIGSWLPPLAVAVLCQTLSHPVQERVRGLEWTRREVFQQAV